MLLAEKFDEFASKKTDFIGPYPDFGALKADCVLGPEVPGYDAYLKCAGKYGFDISSGSLITTAHNPFLLQARYETLSRQLKDFHTDRTGSIGTANDDKIPDFLKEAFAAAVNKSFADGRDMQAQPISVISLSTVRPSALFLLDKKFPALNMHVTAVVQTQDYADHCNELILAEAPELAEKLKYVSHWQGQKADMVVVNAYIPYLQKEELEQLTNDMAETGANQIVIANVVANNHQEGKSYVLGQVYGGGAIPVRVPGYDELEKLMRDTDYSLVGQSRRPFSSHIDSERAIARDGSTFNNYHFIRNEPVL